MTVNGGGDRDLTLHSSEQVNTTLRLMSLSVHWTVKHTAGLGSCFLYITSSHCVLYHVCCGYCKCAVWSLRDCLGFESLLSLLLLQLVMILYSPSQLLKVDGARSMNSQVMNLFEKMKANNELTPNWMWRFRHFLSKLSISSFYCLFLFWNCSVTVCLVLFPPLSNLNCLYENEQVHCA